VPTHSAWQRCSAAQWAQRRGSAARWARCGLLAGLALGAAAQASAQDLAWARGALGSSSGGGVAADAAGNAFVLGSGSGELALSAGRSDQVVLPDGSSQSFVAKYSRAGALLWARAFPGAGAIAADAAGNFYITGSIRGRTVLGEGDHRAVLIADVAGDV